MNTPLVSVITPVYDGAGYIEKTVDTILTQRYQNFELILINDGSTDHSAALIDELAARDSRIQAYHKQNGGIANARNFGISKTKGELVAFCDQDDLWLSDKLEKQIPLFINKKVGLVYCGAHAVYTQIDCANKPLFEKKQKGQVFAALAKENILTCCSVIVRKTHLEQVGGFDDDRALMGVDDWHLWLKIAMITEFDFVADDLCKHVVHANSYSMDNKKMHDAEIVCLNKIKPLAEQKRLNVDWAAIKYSIHIRYAASYVHADNYQLAASAYRDANMLKPSFSVWVKSILLKWIPEGVFRIVHWGVKDVKYKIIYRQKKY